MSEIVPKVVPCTRAQDTHREATGSIDLICRVVSSAPISPREIRLAGLFALVWFVMDAVWFIGTIIGWF